jgi:carboxyl-terminal processing protease
MTLEGVWRSRGYGWILDVRGDEVVCYDDSPRGLIRAGTMARTDLRPAGGGAAEDPVAEPLVYREPCSIAHVEFERVGSLPPQVDPSARDDPLANFDVLWETIRDHYPFFERRGLDWAAVRAGHRERARRASGSPELHAVFESTIASLHDAHAHLRGPESVSSPTPGLAEMRAWITTRAVPVSSMFAGGRIVAGRLDRSLGYVGILSMERCAPGAPGATACDEVRAATAGIDAALTMLEGVAGIVVDVRGNPGGWDAVAFAMAAPFFDRTRDVLSKCARDGDGTTRPQVIAIEPARGRRFSGPVAVLSGGLTASAAEVFLLAMRSRPDVTLVGARTRGILSDELEKHLPNGWVFTLSNEIYRTMDGWCPEGEGIAPQIDVSSPATGDEPARALDAAREVLRASV